MTEHAKLVREIVNLVRRARLDYEGFRMLTRDVRAALHLRRPKKSRHLPKILPEASLRKFYEAIVKGGNLQHEIMLKLLLYTAVRVSELTNIKMSDVDVDAGKIFIESGKGDKDRYILFPDSFRLVLRTYMVGQPKNQYLFEGQRRTKFSVRRVQQLVSDYAAAAELQERVHPHLLRHQMLTFLTKQGMADTQIQLISGHSSKKNLEVYQHVGLVDAAPAYQQAVKGLEV
jgi:site-specific recombinase XerD